eukprot:6184404-Pleurochrysis_carterae.AAC.2
MEGQWSLVRQSIVTARVCSPYGLQLRYCRAIYKSLLTIDSIEHDLRRITASAPALTFVRTHNAQLAPFLRNPDLASLASCTDSRQL